MSRPALPFSSRRGLLALLTLAWLLGGCAGLDSGQPPEQPAPVVKKPLPTRPTPKPAAPVPAMHDSNELVSPTTTAALLPAYVADRTGWAADIHASFAALRLPPTLENACASIAVIEQESSFQVDPMVPGLSRIAWREIETRRERYGIPKLVLDTALSLDSPDNRRYRDRIDSLKTERELSALFDDMISELPNGKTFLGNYNPVRSGGPMQISIDFAEAHARSRPYPYPRQGASLREELFTRRGGLYFGIAALLDYPVPYSQPLYRFADYNAGRYSSRNAAFQQVTARLSGHPLQMDGDLLRYRNGAPVDEDSATLDALLSLNSRLRLTKAELLRDLRLEKTAAFAQTPLYLKLYALSDAGTNRPSQREALPQIAITSPKFQRRFTTEDYARRVDQRFRGCLARRSKPG